MNVAKPYIYMHAYTYMGESKSRGKHFKGLKVRGYLIIIECRGTCLATFISAVPHLLSLQILSNLFIMGIIDCTLYEQVVIIYMSSIL